MYLNKLKLFLTLIAMLSMSFMFGQTTITGTVTDSLSGETLIGVTILVPSSGSGTTTDYDGNFTLELPEGANEIRVSYVGYTTKLVDVSAGGNFAIQLSNNETLDEVIVIGYGTLKKSDKTGAVAQVSADELRKGRISDPIQGLQGKAAGVSISRKGGDPNGGFSVNIRSNASFSGGDPLYVIDGVIGADPTTVNPDDIESFNVLKDASSAAIYGSRGANGVIIITTKNSGIKNSGDQERTNVEYNGFVSVDMVANKLDFLSADEMRSFAERTGRTFIDNGGNVDWQDEIFRTAITHNHSLAFSGAGKSSVYRASIAGNFIDGLLNGTSKERFIGRINLTQKALKDRLTINARLAATFEKNDFVNYGNGLDPKNVIYQAYRRSPTDPVFEEDGVTPFETDRSFQYFNPIAIMNDIQNERLAKRLFGNLDMKVDIYKGLYASASVAYMRDDDETFYFEPSSTPTNTTLGLGSRSYNNGEKIIIGTTLNYDKTINEAHKINTLFGYTWERRRYDGFAVTGKESFSDFVQSNNLSVFGQFDQDCCSSYKNERYLASYLGRFIYGYKDKYLLNVSFRADRDTRFGQNNRWGYFPSISAGWDIKKENFLQSAEFLTQLKLRVGYGTTGAGDNIAQYANRTVWRPNGTAINPETGEVVVTFVQNGNVDGNPNIAWSRIKEMNLGLDFGFFKGRFSGSIEYYRRKTDGEPYLVPAGQLNTTSDLIYSNEIDSENNGVEVTLLGFPVSKKNFKWKTVLVLSHNKQVVGSLGRGSEGIDEDLLGIPSLGVSGRGLVGGRNTTQIIREGLPLGTFFMPEYAGLSDDGKFLFFTEAGGVTRDVTLAERRVVGQAQPKLVGGWSNFFELPFGLDFSFAFRTMIGHSIYNNTRGVFSNPAELPTLNTLQAAVEEYDRGLTSSPTVSSYYLENASFLRLDNVSIGYTVEPLKKKNIGTIRFYVNAANLLTITGYSGSDPEPDLGGREFGLEQFDVYPKARSITFGINTTF